MSILDIQYAYQVLLVDLHMVLKSNPAPYFYRLICGPTRFLNRGSNFYFLFARSHAPTEAVMRVIALSAASVAAATSSAPSLNFFAVAELI